MRPSHFRYDVYLAGPFFSPTQKNVMRLARQLLENEGLQVCDPQDLSPVIVDTKKEERTEALLQTIFVRNIKSMDASHILIACIDDRDIGTAFEIGYFYAMRGSSHIYTFSAQGHGSNVMIARATNGHATNMQEFPSIITAMNFHEQLPRVEIDE